MSRAGSVAGTPLAEREAPRIINLSVVIVRACGRSSNHGKSGFGTAVPQPPCGVYWMPRLKRGMTTREIGEEELNLARMGSRPRVTEQSPRACESQLLRRTRAPRLYLRLAGFILSLTDCFAGASVANAPMGGNWPGSSVEEKRTRAHRRARNKILP
jgi:hypothetical protein